MVQPLGSLQSMLSTIDDLVERIEESANNAGKTEDVALAADLYDVERSLRRAQRRLGRALRERG